jgi:hypothetical protein
MLKNYELDKNNWLTIRIFVSVSLAFIIGYVFSLDRSYWAVLTILSININITWEDLINRSWGRISMTIIGCLVGSLIYQNFLLTFGLLPLLSVIVVIALITVYFTLTSYTLSILFTSFFIVTFFGSLGQWNSHLLQDRIYETLIGAIISIGTALIIYPKLSNKHLKEDINDLWVKQISSFHSLDQDQEARILKAHFLRKKQRAIRERLSKTNMLSINDSFITYYTSTLLLMDDILEMYQKWLDLLIQLEKVESSKPFIDIIIANFKCPIKQVAYVEKNTGDLPAFISQNKLTIHEQILLGYYYDFSLKMYQINTIIRNNKHD